MALDPNGSTVDPVELQVAAEALRDWVAIKVPAMAQHFIEDAMYVEVAGWMLQRVTNYRADVKSGTEI
jgi:hypothetical protein